MRRVLTCGAVPALLLAMLVTAPAQEREDRTLLSWEQMRAIINEVSGERAMHTVLELVPYPRVRAREEYTGQFRESQVMARQAREFGLSDVTVESFPSAGNTWHASRAELWMVQPESRKLYDVYDVAMSVMSGSRTGDVTAELVDVGEGTRAEHYAGKDVKGKIILTSGSGFAVTRAAITERGAAGMLTYAALFPDDVPDAILSQGLGGGGGGQAGAPPVFGWAIAPRVGRELSSRLARGDKITLRSVIQSETFPGELEVVHASIPGDGSTDQAVMVSAHLYEGYQKQGANDDNSGCAATLEMARAYVRLINEGKLPRPRRTIHFLWVPEISGTSAWLRKHEDVKAKLVADLNFDMEGLALRAAGSFWTLHRTPDTFPSFLNDVCASVMEFVANLNRQRVRYRHNGYRFTLPVTAPNGTRDPFYIAIEKHYGASDHVIYLDNGIPAVIFVTWPDPWYHSSQDTPDKLDSTQLKRASVVGVGAISVLASAGDEMGAKVAGESLGRGLERIGQALRKGMGYLADASDAAAMVTAYREALVAVRHQAAVEKEVLRSSAVLFADRAAAEKRLAGLDAVLNQRLAAIEGEVKAFYQLRGGVAAAAAPAEAEQRAARTRVERTGTGGFGASQAALARLPEAERPAIQSDLRKVPTHMASELSILLRKKRTVLEIRDFLSGEFEPLPLADLLAYFQAQQKLGLMKLSEETPPPAPAAAKKRR